MVGHRGPFELADGSLSEPIAITGIGCRFPRGILGPGAYWQLLAEGGSAITRPPASRLKLGCAFDPRLSPNGRIMSRLGRLPRRHRPVRRRLLRHLPARSDRLDPQQRLLLETAWEALEDAGQCPVRPAAGTPASSSACGSTSTRARLFADPAHDRLPHDHGQRAGTPHPAALSFFFDCRAPSLTIDTACSVVARRRPPRLPEPVDG